MGSMAGSASSVQSSEASPSRGHGHGEDSEREHSPSPLPVFIGECDDEVTTYGTLVQGQQLDLAALLAHPVEIKSMIPSSSGEGEFPPLLVAPEDLITRVLQELGQRKLGDTSLFLSGDAVGSCLHGSAGLEVVSCSLLVLPMHAVCVQNRTLHHTRGLGLGDGGLGPGRGRVREHAHASHMCTPSAVLSFRVIRNLALCPAHAIDQTQIDQHKRVSLVWCGLPVAQGCHLF